MNAARTFDELVASRVPGSQLNAIVAACRGKFLELMTIVGIKLRNQRPWRPGPGDLPILSACANWFAGTILERMDLGDHVGFLLAPLDGRHGSAGAEFTFHRARQIDPGHDA